MSNYDLARAILGDDFISPQSIMGALEKVIYTDEQLLRFGATVPALEVLEWCRDNGYVLVAGPPSPMSLLDVRELQLGHFFYKKDGWYEEEPFIHSDKAETGWIMLRKEEVPHSTSKNWDEQQVLLSKDEKTPNVAEFVWCLTIYKDVRNISLFQEANVRTSTRLSWGPRIFAGGFGRLGLDVCHLFDRDRSDHLGLSGARK